MDACLLDHNDLTSTAVTGLLSLLGVLTMQSGLQPFIRLEIPAFYLAVWPYALRLK